jgi:acyl-CoA hydrolase
MNPQELYQKKQMTADQLAACIPDNSAIRTDLFLAQPKTIFEALNRRCQANNIHGCSITTGLELYPLLCYQDPKYAENLRPICQFCSGLSRKAVNGGLADFLPFTYWDQPALVRNYLDTDVFMVSVSPMDAHGYFSMGVTGSACEAYIETARMILVEVNQKMPYCAAAPKVHISQVAGVCEADYPLSALPTAELDEASLTIGGLIAEEIPDGACLQLGIGAIPDAVGMALKDKHHLGIHTEMLTDSMIELLECGAADNSQKETYRGQTVATFAFGSQRIYDYVNHNPSLMILPVDVVNNPYNIAKNSNFVSVNAALEVDFLGQVCAETMGIKIYSGSGGQLDFVRGATMSRGGQSFIAFSSTAKGGTLSKIKPILTPGSAVTTGKNEVDMIVTEYGIARLRGRSMSQRVKALISIAHPKFRDELTFEAKQRSMII